MTDGVKTGLAIGISVVALGVILVGLSPDAPSPPTASERVASLSASIKCPFCNGESLADSQAGVASDYRDLIAERVASGATDEEILSEFVDNFGESYILDSSTSRWTRMLWAVPFVALLVGIGAVVLMKRDASAAVRANE